MEKFQRRLIALLFAVFTLTAATAFADDNNDFGIKYSAETSKKINKHWSVDAGVGFRTRDNAKTADKWDVSVGAGYKITHWLKANAGYQFIYDNNEEKFKYNSTGDVTKWRPSFWGPRHRTYASLTASVKAGRVKFSIRERWQYTYRPEKTTERYLYGSDSWEEVSVRSKSKNVLRSRFQVSYNIPRSKVSPFANVEIYNSWSLDKTRLSAGAEWSITKKHSVEAFYRFQSVNSTDDDHDTNSHILGLGYTFSF